jgi:hypothetical protein
MRHFVRIFILSIFSSIFPEIVNVASFQKPQRSYLPYQHCKIARSQFFVSEQVLPSIIGQFQAAGYQLVTVAECLSAQPYQTVGSPAARDVSKYRFYILSLTVVFVGLMDLRSLNCARNGQMTSGIGYKQTRTVVWHREHCLVMDSY